MAFLAAILPSAAPALAQAPRVLHFGDAVAAATRAAPTVDLASLRVDEARARAGEARAALLPGLSGSAAESNRTFNLKSLGLSLPTQKLITMSVCGKTARPVLAARGDSVQFHAASPPGARCDLTSSRNSRLERRYTS